METSLGEGERDGKVLEVAARRAFTSVMESLVLSHAYGPHLQAMSNSRYDSKTSSIAIVGSVW